MSAARASLGIALGLVLVGCTAGFERADLAMPGAIRIENDGPWNDRIEAGHGLGSVGGPWEVVAEGFAWPEDTFAQDAPPAVGAVGRLDRYAHERRAAERRQQEAEAAPRPDFVLPEPVRQTGPATLPIPTARGATPRREAAADLPREHRFLLHPTRIVAASAVVRLSPALLARARLSGAELTHFDGGGRRASGRARLELFELTVEADRITLRELEPGEAGLRISARGDVGFAARLRGSLVREEGLRVLLITDDEFVPLR